MSSSVSLDDFLNAQQSRTSGYSATLEPLPDQPTLIKVTPFQGGHGCGCSSSFVLPRTAIRSVTPTGRLHHCCGKDLEVVAVEFAENASVPVADLMNRATHHDHHHGPGQGHGHAGPPMPPPGAMGMPGPGTTARRGPAGQDLVGRWPIPWTPCHVTCIEVCTEFCGPTGWDCCKWETRCAINCNGIA